MTKRSIYDTVAIVIYISFLMGVFPVLIEKRGKKKLIRTNKCCNYVILAHLFFYIFLSYLVTLVKNPVLEGKMYNFNTLAKLLILVVTLISVVAVFVMMYLSYLCKDTWRDFFNIIAGIDRAFEKFGYVFDYQRNFLQYLAITFGGPIFLLSNLSLELWNVPRENIQPIPAILLVYHMISFIIIHHGESIFVLSTLILHKRYVVINTFLQKLNQRMIQASHYNGENKMGTITDLIKNYKSEEKILDLCIRSHDKLCDLFYDINIMFGFIVIVGCLLQFNTIVFAFCYCYYNISLRPISALGWFFWTLLRLYELARKAFFAHICAKECQATFQWANKLLIHCNSNVEEKLKIFALQLTHRKMYFTALGLFPLDATFAFTVIGASTTYITIIYQFQVNKLSC